MQLLVSKLTKKYQATIPEPVRRCLSLKAGDTIRFDVDGDKVYVNKQPAVDYVFAEAVGDTLSEWSSAVDDEAYGDL